MNARKTIRCCIHGFLALAVVFPFAIDSNSQSSKPAIAPGSKPLAVVFGTLQLISTTEVDVEGDEGHGKATNLRFQMKMTTIQERAKTGERVGVIYHAEGARKVADKVFPLAGYQEPDNETVGGVGGVASVEIPAAVQQQIANEVIAQDATATVNIGHMAASQQASADVDAGSSGVARMLQDSVPHVFVVFTGLDLTDSKGKECAVSEGDTLNLKVAPSAGSTTADLVVLSSKGGMECATGSTVSVGLADLQEMQNHQREILDQNSHYPPALPPAPSPEEEKDAGPHLFLVSQTIEAIQSSGQLCSLSPGDVLGLIKSNPATALVSLLPGKPSRLGCPISTALLVPGPHIKVADYKSSCTRCFLLKREQQQNAQPIPLCSGRILSAYGHSP
jgi:hypothetical protein